MDDNVEISREMFAKLLKDMPEGNGVSLSAVGDDMHTHLVRPEHLEELANDDSLFHVIFMFTRPGANYYANYLEYTYFTPTTEENNEFQYRAYKWNGVVWAIISIPIEKKDLCYTAAEETNMRLANGIPVKIGIALAATRPEHIKNSAPDEYKDCEFFPLNSDNAFTLERMLD